MPKINAKILKSQLLIGLGIAVLTFIAADLPYEKLSTEDNLHITTLSPKMPYDVDIAEKRKLQAAGKFPEVQRLFEVVSWQAFIGLNWPYDKNGKAGTTITSPGEPLWDTWKESFEIFKEDGSKPSPWGTYDIPDELEENNKSIDCTNDILYRTSKFSHRAHQDFADEIDQAFSTSIWDQNGNIVRYEVRVNEVEFDYIVNNELYNYDGQIDFSKQNGSPVVNFPKGTRDKEGAIEIKLAWKIIEDKDPLANRYLTREVCVYNPDSTFSPANVGLIGMHISMKTASSPQWIWATFEHVDNLEVNELEIHNETRLKPSFYDPDCTICPINVVPKNEKNYYPTDRGDIFKNQIQRVLPISMATQALNKETQEVLAEANSPLQYYQLIGTQWPTDPKAAAYEVYPPKDSLTARILPEAVTNKSGGKPTPTYLTNMVMETYFQGATQDTNYNYLIANTPAWLQIEGFPKQAVNADKLIFGTEGCISCHSSASIAIGSKIVINDSGKKTKTPIFAQRYDYDSKAIGDFSWLLQMKASFKE